MKTKRIHSSSKDPRVLVLYKKSAFASYFDRSVKLKKFININKEEIIRFERTHNSHYRTVKVVEEILRKKKIAFRKMTRGRAVHFDKYDLIITVGGDGTFLEAARTARKQIILGVNSDPKWSVGRFCCTDRNGFDGMIDKVVQGKAKVMLLNRMELRINKKIRIDVVNDILVAHNNPVAMSRYYISFRGKRERQKSSGLWVSTAAGSTGAMHSAGGKVMALSSRALQYKVRELYFGLKNRYQLKGGMIKNAEMFKIISLMESGAIFVDGASRGVPFLFGDEACIRLSQYPLKVVQS